MLSDAEDVGGAPAPTDVLPEPPVRPVRRVGPVAAVTAVLAAVMPPAMSAQEFSQSFVPKFAIMLVFAGLGVVPLIRLAIRSKYAWPARALVGFVLVAVLSAALSPSVLVGFFGLYLWGEGALFFIALAAAWALGATLDDEGRRWLVVGLLIGVTLNACAAVLQSVLHLNTAQADLSGFGLYNGTQADGMMGNPINLEAILVGGLALILGRTCRGNWRWMALVALFAAALELSSERWGVLLLAVLLAYAPYAYRGLRSLKFIGAAVVGFGVPLLTSAGTTLSNRISSGTTSTTYSLRLKAWLQGARVTLAHYPLIGAGPGGVRSALYRYQTVAFVHTTGPSRYFADLHNIFVNIFVMTGIIGFTLFALWAIPACWRVKGGFAGFAALAITSELVEPMNVAVTTLAFLSLGAALSASRGPGFASPTVPDPGLAEAAGSSPVRPGGRGFTIAQVITTFVAALVGVTLVVGDGIEGYAALHFSLDDGKLATALEPMWPQGYQQVAEIYRYYGLRYETPSNLHTQYTYARQWQAYGAYVDPSDPDEWVLVSRADLLIGEFGQSYLDAQKAVADGPNLAEAYGARAQAEIFLHEWDPAVADLKEAFMLEPSITQLAQIIQATERHQVTNYTTGST